MNCAVELVDAMVERGHGERVALRWSQEGKPAAMTYGELAALTNRIAHVLVEDMKLVPGNRLLLRGPNNPMMAASWLAAIKAGLVTVPTMPLLRQGTQADHRQGADPGGAVRRAPEGRGRVLPAEGP